MLSVKKILAGRGAVNYYLEQTRRGLADYYLPEQPGTPTDGQDARITAPGSSWWGATFSPAKSVSLLWASGDRHVQQQVWAAHLAAVDAGLDYLQEHAALVRAGRNSIRVLDSDGLVVARMNEWSSREGDMQLHTHCVILNRARTSVDGRWRVLDGRALLAAKPAAGAIYHRVLEAELSRRLGVAWRTRPDGLRELDGVSDELIAAFSSRRRAITSQVDELVAAYEDRYGVPPPGRYRMAQDATLTSRPAKRELSPDEALDAWGPRHAGPAPNSRCCRPGSSAPTGRNRDRRHGISSGRCSSSCMGRVGRASPAMSCSAPRSTALPPSDVTAVEPAAATALPRSPRCAQKAEASLEVRTVA